ncbi:MAG: hypothetical protein H0T89_14780 [Deltaproteobacteria bacterium]|nr:hypothetical protein [Deltaproteobacteria bacterium]MDQ3295478.1 hypothetical protein [Myxococcota bacterium]
MKVVASLVAVLALAAGCEKKPSKLDGAERMPAISTGQTSGGGGGDLEARVARLEKYNEALDFLQKIYDQQKQQAEQQERSEPAPDAMFAVDITENVKLGMVEGPNAALVTIIEAWDFA